MLNTADVHASEHRLATRPETRLKPQCCCLFSQQVVGAKPTTNTSSWK